MIKIGVARREINPSLSVPHAGWGAQTHVFATGIEADLFTTVLVLSDGDAYSLIIDVDACLFLIEQANEIRHAISLSLGIAAENIRLAVTHTHAGPCFWSNYYAAGAEAVEDYFQYILMQTVNAAAEAKSNLINVTVGVGLGACTIGKNRRQSLANGSVITGFNEQGIADPTVGVIRFEDEANHVVATIVHYSCHPTTLGYTYQMHSPDYPGVTKRMVEQNTEGMCLFLQGSAGNIGPGPEGFLDNEVAMKRMGTQLGAEAVKVSLAIEAHAWDHKFAGVVESGASLGIWQSSRKVSEPLLRIMNFAISLPLKKLMPLAEAEAIYQALMEKSNELQNSGASKDEISQITFQMKRAFLAWDTSRKYNGLTHSNIEVQFLCIDDTVLISCPLEPFVEIGLHLKAQSPFRTTLFSGYSNGHLGYLPIAEAYEAGGYEVTTSPFAQEAAEYFMAEITSRLLEMHTSPIKPL